MGEVSYQESQFMEIGTFIMQTELIQKTDKIFIAPVLN